VTGSRAAVGAAGGALPAGLRAALAASRPDADTGLIRRAYNLAAYLHRDQKRKSGDPYITHPVAVATALAEVGADDQTLCAALLHDTLEGTGWTTAGLRSAFGAEIAGLVTGLAALDAEHGETPRSCTDPFRAAGATEDARVVMIKLADRLHNLRTLRHLPQATQIAKSRQTLEVLVPLAGRVGMEGIRAELQALATGVLKRYEPRAARASGRLLAGTAVLLPRSVRSRWREEWLGELCTLPTRRERAAFAVQTVLGTARLAATLHRPDRSKPR